MKEMIKKVREDRKGFTLMELLIVVAIIAVLVAILIPVFNSSLVKAKEAADVANLRSAYAEAQIAILTDGDEVDDAWEAAYCNVEDAMNYADDKYSYEDGVVTYEATKLDDGKTYTWTLSAEEEDDDDSGSGGGGESSGE